MKIELHKIKISEVVKDYKDSAEEGVSAFGGKLDIRLNISENSYIAENKEMK